MAATTQGLQIHLASLAGTTWEFSHRTNASPVHPTDVLVDAAEIRGTPGREHPATALPPAPARSSVRQTISRPPRVRDPAPAAPLLRPPREPRPARPSADPAASTVVPCTKIDNATSQSPAPPIHVPRPPRTDASSPPLPHAPRHNTPSRSAARTKARRRAVVR